MLLGEVAMWVTLYGIVKLRVSRLLSTSEGTVAGSAVARMTV